LRTCHICLEKFCPFHIDRHNHEKAATESHGVMGLGEDWRVGV
jgi:hypothetical protein